MSLFTGQTYNLLSGAGITDYQSRLDQNFSFSEEALNVLDGRVQTLESASPANAADAINNIPNLIPNGDFQMALCCPNDPTASLSGQPSCPEKHPITDVYQVKWADCWWWLDDVQPGNVEVWNMDFTSGALTTQFHPGFDPAGVKVIESPTAPAPSAAKTGVLFTRLDYYHDLSLMRDKVIQFQVLYQATIDNSFYLEIDDGVTQSTNQALAGGPSPTGTGTSFVQHLVDTNATKLTVKIVFVEDAPAALANATHIQYAYARLGTGTGIAIPSRIPPQWVERDLIYSLMTHRIIEFYRPSWAESSGGGTVSFITVEMPLGVPLVHHALAELVQNVYLAGDSGDARDMAKLASAPAWSLRRQNPMFPTLGKSLALRLAGAAYTHVIISMRRDTGTDPNPAPATGFYSDLMGCGFSTIPSP